MIWGAGRLEPTFLYRLGEIRDRSLQLGTPKPSPQSCSSTSFHSAGSTSTSPANSSRKSNDPHKMFERMDLYRPCPLTPRFRVNPESFLTRSAFSVTAFVSESGNPTHLTLRDTLKEYLTSWNASSNFKSDHLIHFYLRHCQRYVVAGLLKGNRSAGVQ